MKEIEIQRRVTLVGIDSLTIEVPDDFDLDEATDTKIYNSTILAEDRQIIDSVDWGAWEMAP